jgi:hypothetical protein
MSQIIPDGFFETGTRKRDGRRLLPLPFSMQSFTILIASATANVNVVSDSYFFFLSYEGRCLLSHTCVGGTGNRNFARCPFWDILVDLNASAGGNLEVVNRFAAL